MKKKTLFLFVLLCPSLVLGEISSTNYFISRDSVNSFGNENSKSTNYILSDTGGEFSAGFTEGISYITNSGFRQLDQFSFSINCNKNNINMSSLKLHGKSDLSNNFLDCVIKTNNPSGYTLQINAKTNELVSIENPQYKINNITNTSTDFWPTILTEGTGWGLHIGSESDGFDSDIWGTTDDYTDTGGKWISVNKNLPVSLVSKNSATDIDGDNQRIYFGFEIDENTVVPNGEYDNTIDFILTPSF